MINLLKETEEYMKETGQKPEDICFIGCALSGHECTWDEYKVLADVEYDNDCGGQEVMSDLILRFKNGTVMHRQEYEGYENWDCIFGEDAAIQKKNIQSLMVEDYRIGSFWDMV